MPELSLPAYTGTSNALQQMGTIQQNQLRALESQRIQTLLPLEAQQKQADIANVHQNTLKSQQDLMNTTRQMVDAHMYQAIFEAKKGLENGSMDEKQARQHVSGSLDYANNNFGPAAPQATFRWYSNLKSTEGQPFLPRLNAVSAAQPAIFEKIQEITANKRAEATAQGIERYGVGQGPGGAVTAQRAGAIVGAAAEGAPEPGAGPQPPPTQAAPTETGTMFPRAPGAQGGDEKLTGQGTVQNLPAIPSQPAQTMKTDLGKKVLEDSKTGFDAANTTKYQLGIIKHGIEGLGPSWMGTGADAMAKGARLWNTMGERLKSVFPDNKEFSNAIDTFKADPEKVKNWESFTKATTQLGFALGRTLGARVAENLINQALSAVPNANQSYLGAMLVHSSLNELANRAQDLHQYLLSKGMDNPALAEAQFNREHPVEEYVDKAIHNSLPRFKSAEEIRASKLPKGTPFYGITEDGTERLEHIR